MAVSESSRLRRMGCSSAMAGATRGSSSHCFLQCDRSACPGGVGGARCHQRVSDMEENWLDRYDIFEIWTVGCWLPFGVSIS